MSETVTLYRPVGARELALIKGDLMRSFPPRLREQPIFYPVENETYAREIAQRWNVRDSGSGFVTRFQIDRAYLAAFALQKVGASHHFEYWIPAEQLAEFNRHIVGPIEIIARFA